MWERQVADNARRFQELTERVARLRITESSPDGTVRVTVSANGLLTDLVLRDSRYPRPAAETAAQIMDCLQRAQARIPDLLQHEISSTVGAQDPSAQLLINDARQRFPAPPPRLEPRLVPDAVPVPPRQTTQPRDEDDWDGREIMQDI
ncbi:YbaB/EbfC family nucleoid-associated protein [Actinocrispum sp. NPDC049592]|uniref:YbaB/EbfC family nucleoid-associated protein n=1 Tax=Actinocrispum sp. NPDC049592 TaxID=3154835 RepID=UPI003434C6C3